MNELLNTINHFFEQVPDRLRQHRLVGWLVFIVLTGLVASSVGRLQIDMSMEAFFQEDEPAKQAYDRFKSLFGGDENVYIVYKAKDGDIFSATSLQALQGIQEDLLNYRLYLKPGQSSPLDHVTDVKTLINVKYMEAKEGTLLSRDFIGNQLPQTDKEKERLRQQALAHPDYPLLYFSNNSQYGGILIKTDFNAVVEEGEENLNNKSGASLDEEELLDDEEDASFELSDDNLEQGLSFEEEFLPKFKKAEMQDYAPFVQALDNILSKPEYTNVLEFYPVGNPILMAFFNDIIMTEMSLIIIGSLVLVTGILWLLFRSFSAVIWPVLIVILSIVWVIGLIGWSGIAMTQMVQIIVFLVLAVGIADAVHILSGYLFFRNQNQDHETALRSVFKKSGLACFLTSVTTSIGLLALIFVPIVPLQTFGMFAAVGVFSAFVFTVFLLPLMLDLWSPFSKKRAQRIATLQGKDHIIQKILKKFDSLSLRYPVPVIGVFFLTGGILLYGALQIRVDSNIVEIIKETTPIRKTYDLVDRFMGGVGNMEILVDTQRIDGLKDPLVLNAMEDLQNYIEAKHQKIVAKTSSLVNVTKDSFKTLNEGREEMYIIPQDPHILEQTLFLFNNANPKDRRQLVSDNYRMGRIGINLKNLGSQQGMVFISDVQSHMDELFAPLRTTYPNLEVTITGQLSLMAMMAEYISWSQIKSFGLALVVISLLLLVVFGSKRIGLVAVLPNIFPVITIFGIMGYLDIPLDVDTLLIAPITIGIAVDDTIHFLTHYRLEMQKHGDMQKAIIHAFREAGQAIAFTSLILSIGFLIFIFSIHQGLSNFGIFSAIAIMTALLADLFLLPSMCVVFNAQFSQENRHLT